MNTIAKNQAGFTLLELLISITIFAIGMLAIAGLQVNAIRFNSGSNLRTAATGVAQAVMEQIMAMDGSDTRFRTTLANRDWDFDENDPSPDTNPATPIVLPGGGTYSATWSVNTDNPVTRMSRITVNVQAPQNRVVTLTSFRRYNF